jgi:S-adenosylmethionine:tRNA ribosyltransferase-isomerase
MQRTDFSFHLPKELIAQYPSASRTASRLLYLDTHADRKQDLHFTDLPKLLKAGDLLVFNNTRVIPARLFGYKASGGKVEILIERLLDTHRALAHVRASHSPKPQSTFYLIDKTPVTVLQRVGNLFELYFGNTRSVLDTLHAIGHVPLPPYIHRVNETIDLERYQTVYASQPGAVAAPTAGLHFDQALLKTLQAADIQSTFVTLHVGAGTFAPVKVTDIRQHVMHAEYVEVSKTACTHIQSTRAQGRRIVAIGTTSVRALETASQQGDIQPYQGETRLFITPGYPFRSVDALLTNFHLPESTLLMLVCAFAGQARVLSAYQHAITQRYRFFSYGDAMFISGMAI